GQRRGFGLVALLSANVCRSATNHRSKAGRREDGGKKQGLSGLCSKWQAWRQGAEGFCQPHKPRLSGEARSSIASRLRTRASSSAIAAIAPFPGAACTKWRFLPNQ